MKIVRGILVLFLLLMALNAVKAGEGLSMLCFQSGEMLSEHPLDQETEDLLLSITKTLPEHFVFFTGPPDDDEIYTLYRVEDTQGRVFVFMLHDLGEDVVGVTLIVAPELSVFYVAHGFHTDLTNQCAALYSEGKVNA